VVAPFLQGGANGLKALIEIASPVGFNCATDTPGADSRCPGTRNSGDPDIHIIFYDNACGRQVSTPLPETENEIAFIDPQNFTGAGVSGLALIAGQPNIGNLLQKLQSPIHTRVYEFNSADGRSRILEPIIIDTAEFGVSKNHTSKLWSPLRTGATFYAPFEGLDPVSGLILHTQLTFICPRDSIQGGASAPFGAQPTTDTPWTNTGFPQIDPPFWTFSTSSGITSLGLTGIVYDVDENFLADITFGCDCLSPDVPVNTLTKSGTTYSTGANVQPGSPLGATHGTYSEIFVTTSAAWAADPVANRLKPGSFVVYRDIFAQGSALNKFWGRLSTGSVGWLQGIIQNDSR
jgi:hypothetical protein